MEDRGEGYAAFLNGDELPVVSARIPITDEGFLRGDGVFEVIRLYLGHPFKVAEHLGRLARSAQILGIPYDLSSLQSEVGKLTRNAGGKSCDMRIVVTRGGTRLVMLEALRPAASVARLVPMADQPRPLLNGAKTLSYAANMLAEATAREAGGTDALLTTPDHLVLESQTAAFFWADRQGSLVTPPLTDGVLDSITRRVVIKSMQVEERSSTLQEAMCCSEAFLAGTTREVQPVGRIGNVTLSPVPGPLTQHAVQSFWGEVQRQTGVRMERLQKDASQ